MNSESETGLRPDYTVEASVLLRRARVIVAPESFVLLSLSHEDFGQLIHRSAISPNGGAPFLVFSDKFEVTLVMDEVDFRKLRHAIGGGRAEHPYRLLTFDVELELGIVGFMAEVTAIMAEASVPIVALSSFSRDHLLIRQDDLARALKSLGPFVAELC